MLIGLFVGLWAVGLFHTLDWVCHEKLVSVERAIARGGLWEGFAVWLLWSVMLSAGATLCCVVYDLAAGSGVPEVMAFLNGVVATGAFRIQVLILKSISCICAVSSGLPVGAEGPMIHIGALMGGGLSSGRSRTLGCGRHCLKHLFETFQNPKDRRDFITAGSAAGVAAVFGSPLGGLFFVMEELASFMPAKLGWLTFWSCLLCFLTQQFLNSYLDGWLVRERPPGTRPLAIPEASAALFNMNQEPEQAVPLYISSTLPSAVLGVVLAVVAGAFIKLHLRIVTRWRAPIVNVATWRKALEPVALATVVSIYWFWIPQAFDCRPIPPSFLSPNRTDLHGLHLFTAGCPQNGVANGTTVAFWHKSRVLSSEDAATTATHFNPAASLTLTSTYNAIRLLLSRNTGDFLPSAAIFAYFIVYTLGAATAVGMFISSGVVIPTIVIGSACGRLLCNNLGVYWAEPGTMALVGAAAFFGGLSRLTFSIAVIMVEISNDLSHVLLLMLAIIVSKLVGDRLCHSLYHEQLAVRGVPFLDFDTQVHKLDAFTAGDIMTHNPISLSVISTVADLWAAARSSHHGLPVVRDAAAGDQTFLGLVQREEIEKVLWHMYLSEVDNGPNVDPTLPSHADLRAIEQYLFWDRAPSLPVETSTHKHRRIDITPFVDCSAFFVLRTAAVSRAYNLFRAMSLRHLCVVDSGNQLVGMITRRDLLGHSLRQKCHAAALDAARESDGDASDTEGLVPAQALPAEVVPGTPEVSDVHQFVSHR